MNRIISLLIFVLLTIGTTNVVFAQAAEQNGGMDAAALEARIRAQALRIFPWTMQEEQREQWIADRLSKQLDRQAARSYAVQTNQ
jgi:hypothetical protein